LDNQLFLGKNKKFSQRWIGPYLVKKVISEKNLELQISPKRVQIHSAYRLKKFIDPKSSRFLNEEKQKKERADNQNTKFNTGKYCKTQKEKLSNEEIKARIEQRITRSMTNKMLIKEHSSQAISAINNLIIPEMEKLKLKTIANKIYHSITLTQEEKVFWNSFPNSEKSYILLAIHKVLSILPNTKVLATLLETNYRKKCYLHIKYTVKNIIKICFLILPHLKTQTHQRILTTFRQHLKSE
jgi:hypothetical protein